MSINKEILRVAVLNILNESSIADHITGFAKKAGDYLKNDWSKTKEHVSGAVGKVKHGIEAGRSKLNSFENTLEARGRQTGGVIGHKIGIGIEKHKPTPIENPLHPKDLRAPYVHKGIKGERIGAKVLGTAGKYTPRGGIAGAVGTGAYLGGDAIGSHINSSISAANKAAQHAADSKISLAHAHNMNMAKHAEDSDHSKRNALVASGAGAAGIGALALHRKKK